VTNAALAWLIVVSSIAVAAAWRGGWPRRA
jgi:hypothetical protein